PRNITMVMASDLPGGVKWIGTKGWVYVSRGKFEASKPDWDEMRELPEDLRKVKLYVSTNHYKNFLDCVASRKPTITPVEVGHHSAVPGHLGIISMFVGRKIRWDVATEKILDDPEASAFLTRPFRGPWKLA